VGPNGLANDFASLDWRSGGTITQLSLLAQTEALRTYEAALLASPQHDQLKAAARAMALVADSLWACGVLGRRSSGPGSAFDLTLSATAS
jgi:hypothetical protein